MLFADFRVDQDGISVWKGSTKVVAQIVAAGRERIGSMALLEISEGLLAELDIAVEVSLGDNPHPKSHNRHRSIQCFSGPLLARLVSRLSVNPSYTKFRGVEVRQMLAESIRCGLSLDALNLRVLVDLLHTGDVSKDAALPVLERHIEKDPLCIAQLKPTQVDELIKRGIVTREAATIIHSSYRRVQP